jgi:hypothetical protein
MHLYSLHCTLATSKNTTHFYPLVESLATLIWTFRYDDRCIGYSCRGVSLILDLARISDLQDKNLTSGSAERSHGLDSGRWKPDLLPETRHNLSLRETRRTADRRHVRFLSKTHATAFATSLSSLSDSSSSAMQTNLEPDTGHSGEGRSGEGCFSEDCSSEGPVCGPRVSIRRGSQQYLGEISVKIWWHHTLS